MGAKPTYEELEQKVAELQKDVIQKTYAGVQFRRSAEEWETIFEAFGHPVFILDTEQRLIKANSATIKAAGGSSKDLIGKKCYEIFHKTDAPPAGCPFEKAKKSQIMEVEEMEVALLNGQYLVSCTPIFDSEGRVEKMIHTATDVTDRKAAVEALQESERMLRETQEISEIGGWEYHVGEKRIKWTDQVYRIYGVTRDSFNPNDLNQDLSFYVPEDRETVARAFRAAVDKGESYDLGLRFVSAEGKHLWVRTIGHPVLKNGKVVKVVGNLMDITEQKRSEEMLKAERLKFERYFERIPLMAYNVSFDGRIVDCNAVAVKALGYTSKESLLGKPVISTLYAKDSQRKAKRIFEKWKAGARIKNEELSAVTRQGQRIEVLLNVDTVLDDQGKPIYSISTHLDITERKRAQEESQRLQARLRQAQKMAAIATLTGGIAHDYNNLLSVIIGNLSLAMEEIDTGSDLADFLEEANRASLKVRDLTHELMSLSKAGGPVKALGSLRDLVRIAMDAIPPESDVSLKVSISEDLWSVFYDPFKMGTVFKNVTTNAVEAMPYGGDLSISAENLRIKDEEAGYGLPLTSGDYVHIAFHDQGLGILKEHLEKIFDPYFSTKSRGVQKGMGLGLATTYAIIEKHGGHISVDSKPGVGTTVNIYLPAEKRPVDSAGTIPEDDSKSHVKRVLVMEDEEMLRHLAEQMLKRLGFSVETAKDGIEAIETFKKREKAGEPFDALILDLTIKGGMGGLQTLGELLKIDPHIKAIVTSGYFDDPVMSDFEKYGFVGAMPKPYGKQVLKNALVEIGLAV